MLPVNDGSRRFLLTLAGLLVSPMSVAFVQFPGFRLLLFLVLVDALLNALSDQFRLLFRLPRPLRGARNCHRLFAGLRGWLRVFRVTGHRFAGNISVGFGRVYLEKPAMLSSFRQFDPPLPRLRVIPDA